MLSRAAVAMWWDVPSEVRPEWEEWHSHEHMPERLAIPGFLRGTRWVAHSGEPSYFVLYETKDLKTITGGAYLERLDNPTPWSRKMMPHHRNMVRSLCRVGASFGGGLAHALATIRFSPAPESGRSAVKWLVAQVMPSLPQRKGLTGTSFLESQPVVPQTAEQRIRGGDRQADCVLLISGYDAEAVKAAVAAQVGELEGHGALPGSIVGFYRCAYSLTSKDLPR
jgi:hypothetical protein